MVNLEINYKIVKELCLLVSFFNLKIRRLKLAFRYNLELDKGWVLVFGGKIWIYKYDLLGKIWFSLRFTKRYIIYYVLKNRYNFST